jgi:hypothetical protein
MNPNYSAQLDAANIPHAELHFSEARDAEFCISITRQSVVNSNDKRELIHFGFLTGSAAWNAMDALNLRDDDEACDNATLLINGEDKMNKGRWL